MQTPAHPELRSTTREAQSPEPFSHASEHDEAFTAGAWSPCHLPPPSEISRLTAVERLWAVQQTLEAFGFTSVADVLLTELSTGGRTSVGVGKRTERFFRDGEALKVLCAITSHPKYSNTELLKNDEFVAYVGRFITPLARIEINRLVCDASLTRPFLDFRPEVFENPKVFAHIEERQRANAPILTNLLQTLAKVEIGRQEDIASYTTHADIQDGPNQERTKALRNRRLISVVALQMIGYACNKHCNIVQSLTGVFLYATNTPKRTLETLHQFGISCAYDSVLNALR